MSSKRKPNNPKKRMASLASSALRNQAVMFTGGDDGKCSLVDLNTNHVYKPIITIVEALENLPFQWSVLICVLCRGNDGKNYMQSEAYIWGKKYRQKELSFDLNQEHGRLIKSSNPSHLVNICWLAAPNYKKEIPESKAWDIFSKDGAFDYLADWEIATH